MNKTLSLIARELLKRKRPVTRERLCEISGLSDRDLRRAIEELRIKGFPVLSSPAVAGYWLARDERELVDHKVLIIQKCRAEIEIHNSMALYRIDEIRKEIQKNG